MISIRCTDPTQPEDPANQLQSSFPNTVVFNSLYHCLQTWCSKSVHTDYTPVEIRWRTDANCGQPVPGALPGAGSKGIEPFNKAKVEG